MVDPYFAMLWGEDIPRLSATDDDGRRAEVTVIAGALDGTVRTLYVFEGSVVIGGRDLEASTGAVLCTDEPVVVAAGPYGAEALVLQGRPIGEPVVQYGPASAAGRGPSTIRSIPAAVPGSPAIPTAAPSSRRPTLRRSSD